MKKKPMDHSKGVTIIRGVDAEAFKISEPIGTIKFKLKEVIISGSAATKYGTRFLSTFKHSKEEANSVIMHFLIHSN